MVGFKQRNSPLSLSPSPYRPVFILSRIMTFSILPCLIADEVFKNFQKIQIQFVKKGKIELEINFFLFVNKVIRNEPRFSPSFIFLLFFNHGANLGYMVSLGLIFLNDPYFGRLI